jgi:tetratricopeptide (TPR) repeat protein
MDLRKGSFELAKEEAQEVLKRDPKSLPAHIILGNVYLNEKEISKAEQSFAECIRIAPDSPAGYYHKSRALLADGRKKEALGQLEKALAIQPDFLEALHLIVGVHLDQKDPKRAIERVEAQIKISPDNPFFYDLLGRLYESNKDVAKAEKNYQKAIEIDPNIAGFYVSLGNFYVLQNMAGKAIEKYNLAIQKDSTSISAYMSLGVIYENQKKYDKAKENYQMALKIDPGFAPAANNLAYLYAETGENIDVALNLAQSAKQQVPDDPSVCDTIGWVYYKKSIYRRALDYLKEANEKVPDHPVMRYHLGMAYYKNGDRDQAKIELRKALALNSEFPCCDEARAMLKILQ